MKMGLDDGLPEYSHYQHRNFTHSTATGAKNYYRFFKKVRTHRKRKATCTKKKEPTGRKKEPTRRKSKPAERKSKPAA